MNDKKAVLPKVKMKVFQWTKMPSRKIKDTIFAALDDEEMKFNYEEIEKLFATKVISKTNENSEEKKAAEKESKPKPGSGGCSVE